MELFRSTWTNCLKAITSLVPGIPDRQHFGQRLKFPNNHWVRCHTISNRRIFLMKTTTLDLPDPREPSCLLRVGTRPPASQDQAFDLCPANARRAERQRGTGSTDCYGCTTTNLTIPLLPTGCHGCTTSLTRDTVSAGDANSADSAECISRICWSSRSMEVFRYGFELPDPLICFECGWQLCFSNIPIKVPQPAALIPIITP